MGYTGSFLNKTGDRLAGKGEKVALQMQSAMKLRFSVFKVGQVARPRLSGIGVGSYINLCPVINNNLLHFGEIG